LTLVGIWVAAPAIRAASLERLTRNITELASNGSRLAGYPGDVAAADLVEGELRAAGVPEVVREEFEVVVPVDRGSRLRLLDDGTEIPLTALWPNMVRTTTTGPDGLTGDLFYGGTGEFQELDGQQVNGSLVLMEFNTWNNWLNPASLGARAIIFIAPEQTTVFEARQKWNWAPLEVARFWLEREEGLALKERLAGGAVKARVWSRMDWEERPSWNVWGVIPGADPLLAQELWAVQTYYDGLSVAPALTPAAESAVGVATLLELAHHLGEHPPGRSVLLLATGGHFTGQAGLKDFLNRHARKRLEFRLKMPQRFVADSLDVDRLLAATARRGTTPDSLGVVLGRDPATGGHTLVSVDLDTLLAKLRLMGMRSTPDSLGIRLEPDSLAIELFISLDLSSHSDQLGIWHNTRDTAYRRFFVPVGRSFARYGAAAGDQLGYEPGRALVNGISPIKGLTWSSYISGDVAIPDGIIAQKAGQMAISLMTVNDSRLQLDTPLDTPRRVAFANVQRQCALLNSVLHAALCDSGVFGSERAELRALHDGNLTDQLVDVRGALRLLPRKGTTTPNVPVPHGVVAIEPSFLEDPWRPVVALADEEGSYRVSGLTPGTVDVQAFVLDEETGSITYATDLGERAQAFGQASRGLSKAETQWTTVLFPAESIEIYDRIHSQYLFTLGRSQSAEILDERGATPSQYGYVQGDWMSTVMVLFGRAEDSLRVVEGCVLLLNNEDASDEKSAQGVGYSLTDRRMVEYGTLEYAGNLWRLNEVRNQRMRQHSIENPRIQARHQRARQLLDAADRARADLRWGEYVEHARAGLGLELQAYGDVRGTQNDVIAGIVFFVALLVPAAFFAERLLFAHPDIRKQLALFGLILLVIWIVLSQVHPAFQLAHPAIILLALMIVVMACFVITLLLSRFNAFMTELRQRRSGTTSGDISRSGAAYVAFMLGISNMRRRVMRTGLTLATITLLTFTVLSFASFRPGVSFVGFDKDWEPPYCGALLHDVQWWPWEYTVLDYFRSHFADHGTVVPRTWLPRGFQEKTLFPVLRDPFQADAGALLGLAVDEPKVTGIDRALIAGSWFEEEREQSAILSGQMAQQLGIGPTDVGRESVAIFGQDWLVRGIFDATVFQEIRDLNDEPLTPAKQKLAQSLMPGMAQLAASALLADDMDLELGVEHLRASRVVVLPYAVLESMDAPLYSVAVRFDEEADGEDLVQQFLTRTGFRFFLGVPGSDGRLQALAYTSLGVTSLEGLGALFIPMLIAGLIVLNTMMGAVYERFREIGVYSSVGLAPLHIAFLFVAEACVYGVLGVTIGYILGQVVAKLLIVFDMVGGVSLNYSSSAAIGSAVLVMLVVLASTAYPARVASQLAVPDVVRRWQLPDPEGDVWCFPFPFTVNRNAIESLCGYLYRYFTSYGHESVGKLYTERTRILSQVGPDGAESYAVQLLVWLAPFDMGVSQYLQFTIEPTDVRDIHGIELWIERISGPVAFWQRLNLAFMLDMRKQFLVWQTLKEELHAEHADLARQVALDASSVEGVPSATTEERATV